MSEMRIQGASHMYMDISHRSADWLCNRFPTIYEHCLRYGLDMTRQPLPVVPAAHYFCGGVTTDLTGRTTVPGLFAAGEIVVSLIIIYTFHQKPCVFEGVFALSNPWTMRTALLLCRSKLECSSNDAATVIC